LREDLAVAVLLLELPGWVAHSSEKREAVGRSYGRLPFQYSVDFAVSPVAMVQFAVLVAGEEGSRCANSVAQRDL
jgi:hypothetical protein